LDHPALFFEQWRSYGIVTVHHDSQGRIVRVDPVDDGAPEVRVP